MAVNCLFCLLFCVQILTLFVRLISHFRSQFLLLPISFVCIVTLIVIRDRSCQRQTCDGEDYNNDDEDDDDDDNDDDIGYRAMILMMILSLIIKDWSSQCHTCDDKDDTKDDDENDCDINDIGYWAMMMMMILSLIMIRDRSCHRQTLQTKSLISEANYFCDKSSAAKFDLLIRD